MYEQLFSLLDVDSEDPIVNQRHLVTGMFTGYIYYRSVGTV